MAMLPQINCILGGTFDPIHHGHIHLANTVANTLGAPISFLPCAQPIHKPQALASTEHRINMLKLALKDQAYWTINQLEIAHARPRSTYQTCLELRQQSDQTHCCLIGSDSLATLTTWHDWQKLADLTHFIVLNRSQQPRPFSPKIKDYFIITQQKEQLYTQKTGVILQLNTPAKTISSTFIRECIANNQSIEHSVPDQVLQYIQQYQLYQNTIKSSH